MPVVAMAASVLLTLTSGLVLAATFLWWRWWHSTLEGPSSTSRPVHQGREFGAFEKVMHHLRQECGHHNMSLVLRFHETLDCERLRSALRVVQARHVLLQSTVVLDSKGRPSFQRLDHPPAIPVIELEPETDASAEASTSTNSHDAKERRGVESEEACRAEDLRILTRELNSGFEGTQPLLRCTVIQPSAPPPSTHRTKVQDEARGLRSSTYRPRVRMVITVAHDLMDGRSLALLGVEIIELYRHPPSHSEQSSHDPFVCAAAPIPPPIEAVMLPSWMPKPVAFARHLLSFLQMHRYFAFDHVRALPHTARNVCPAKAASSEAGSVRPPRPLWSTGVVERRLSREETARLQHNGRTMGASVGVQLMTAAFLATTAGALKQKANVWGVQLIDMRRQMLVKLFDSASGDSMAVAPTALGQFLSSIDICHRTDPSMLPPLPPSPQDGASSEEEYVATLFKFFSYFRQQCAIVRARTDGCMRRGGHLTSLIFAQYLAAFSAYHSRYFKTPFPCPAFSMSNVGSMDDAQPGGPLEGVVRALNGRNPMLDDMSFGVSAASSFPFVSITALTLRGSLRLVLNYPTNTVATAAIDELADAFLRVLRLAATEGAHDGQLKPT